MNSDRRLPNNLLNQASIKTKEFCREVETLFVVEALVASMETPIAYSRKGAFPQITSPM